MRLFGGARVVVTKYASPCEKIRRFVEGLVRVGDFVGASPII